MINTPNNPGLKTSYNNLLEFANDISSDEPKKPVSTSNNTTANTIKTDNVAVNKPDKTPEGDNVFAGKGPKKVNPYSDSKFLTGREKDTSPVQLGNNIVNPADIDSRYQLNGPAPTIRNTGDGSKIKWDKPLDEIGNNLGSGDEYINNISKLIDDIDYKPNTVSDNAFRRPVGEVWQGKDTHGECSDIHNIATYLLNQKGIEAYTVQMGRASGFHNVTIFKDTDGTYDIMEYGKIHKTSASSPEDAMRKFQNDAVGEMYRYVIYTPSKDGFKVRSIGQNRATAVFDKFTSTPNLDFNTFVGGKLNDGGLYVGSDGIQMNGPEGIKFTSQMHNGKIDNAGLGKYWTNKDGVTSGVSLMHDVPTNMTVAQYQRFKDDYKWVSAGVMYHSPISPVAKLENGELGQVNMPTLAPFVGGSYGGEKDLVKNDALRLSINGFIQGRVALPFVLTEEGRQITNHSQNGNASFMDFGQALGFYQLKAGTGANLDFTPWKVGDGQVQMSLGYKAKYDIVDPTLIYSDPGAYFSNTGTASIKYTTPVGKDLKLTANVAAQITDSKFVYEQNRLDGAITLKQKDDKWGIGVTGAVAQKGFAADADRGFAVGANGFYMFNEKVGLMGGVGYDSTASQLNSHGTGFNVGVGTIYKF
jgi:hypothetical protein